MHRQDVGCSEESLEIESYQTFPVQRLAYDTVRKTCVADAPLPVGITIGPEYKTLWKKRWFKFGWPRMGTVLDVLMVPIKNLSVVGVIADVALNWNLTRVGSHLPPNIYFVHPYKTERITENDIEAVQRAMDDLQAKQEDIFLGKWRAFSILPEEIKTSRKGKEKESESDVPKHLLQVNAFLLNTKPKKLHINMHGMGSSGNSYDVVAPEAASMWQADQWNVTRVQVASIHAQKQQVRQVIAAAIQAGYEDIRLDGYSYGAGLVRTVYHELMEDKRQREFLEKRNITLHYTARNGYKSEGLTLFAYLSRFGERKTPDYKKRGVHAPKPNLFMRFGHFVAHHILRIDTLRNRRITTPIPETSHNYVVNAVLSEKMEKKTLMRDGVIGYTNRSNGEKFGHTCIDVDFPLQSSITRDETVDENSCSERAASEDESTYNGYYTEERYSTSSRKHFRRHWAPVMEPNLFRLANEEIAADIALKSRLTEKDAKKKITRLQHKILVTEEWKVKVGRQISYNKGQIKKRVPTGIKKQLDVIKEAYKEEQRVLNTRKGETHWRAAFFKLAEIGREAAEASSASREASTQKFYDQMKTSSLLDQFTKPSN